jgi:hypothetical protein
MLRNATANFDLQSCPLSSKRSNPAKEISPGLSEEMIDLILTKMPNSSKQTRKSRENVNSIQKSLCFKSKTIVAHWIKLPSRDLPPTK